MVYDTQDDNSFLGSFVSSGNGGSNIGRGSHLSAHGSFLEDLNNMEDTDQGPIYTSPPCAKHDAFPSAAPSNHHLTDDDHSPNQPATARNAPTEKEESHSSNSPKEEEHNPALMLCPTEQGQQMCGDESKYVLETGCTDIPHEAPSSCKDHDINEEKKEEKHECVGHRLSMEFTAETNKPFLEENTESHTVLKEEKEHKRADVTENELNHIIVEKLTQENESLDAKGNDHSTKQEEGEYREKSAHEHEVKDDGKQETEPEKEHEHGGDSVEEKKNERNEVEDAQNPHELDVKQDVKKDEKVKDAAQDVEKDAPKKNEQEQQEKRHLPSEECPGACDSNEAKASSAEHDPDDVEEHVRSQEKEEEEITGEEYERESVPIEDEEEEEEEQDSNEEEYEEEIVEDESEEGEGSRMSEPEVNEEEEEEEEEEDEDEDDEEFSHEGSRIIHMHSQENLLDQTSLQETKENTAVQKILKGRQADQLTSVERRALYFTMASSKTGTQFLNNCTSMDEIGALNRSNSSLFWNTDMPVEEILEQEHRSHPPRSNGDLEALLENSSDPDDETASFADTLTEAILMDRIEDGDNDRDNKGVFRSGWNNVPMIHSSAGLDKKKPLSMSWGGMWQGLPRSTSVSLPPKAPRNSLSSLKGDQLEDQPIEDPVCLEKLESLVETPAQVIEALEDAPTKNRDIDTSFTKDPSVLEGSNVLVGKKVSAADIPGVELAPKDFTKTESFASSLAASVVHAHTCTGLNIRKRLRRILGVFIRKE